MINHWSFFQILGVYIYIYIYWGIREYPIFDMLSMLQTNPQNYSAGWKECLNADVHRPSRMILLHPPQWQCKPQQRNIINHQPSTIQKHPVPSLTITIMNHHYSISSHHHPSPSFTILHHHHELSAAARLRIFFFVFNDLLAANVRRADLGPLDHGRPVRDQQPEDLSKLIKFELLYVRSI